MVEARIATLRSEFASLDASPVLPPRPSVRSEGLTKFAQRRLSEDYPYLILDARYEKVRDDGIIQSQAVLIAIGINWAGKRQVLGVELATARVNRAGGSFCWRSNSAA